MAHLAGQALAYPAFGGHALAVWLTHLVGYDEVAISGAPAQPLIRTVWETFRPQAVIAVATASASTVPLLDGRGGADGEARAFVCHELVCELPVETPDDLRSLLAPTA